MSISLKRDCCCMDTHGNAACRDFCEAALKAFGKPNQENSGMKAMTTTTTITTTITSTPLVVVYMINEMH